VGGPAVAGGVGARIGSQSDICTGICL
jgi:hypothetical protein